MVHLVVVTESAKQIGIERFGAALIAAAAKSLKGKVERVGEQITKFFSKLRPELSFSITPGTQSWGSTLLPIAKSMSAS